jgi:hypothetical protein
VFLSLTGHVAEEAEATDDEKEDQPATIDARDKEPVS